ncbi:MAG: magnesium/cobalt transporter CorA [Ktedonobacteraceae bacterium]|nr:magnesium/cobalt transporter CorA [Ktedonobacteraceae bacterium]
MHKAIHCDTKEHTFKRLTSIEELREARQDPNAVVWLDLLDPSDEDLARVEHGFQLHPLAIEDATHEHQRPKVDEYENFFFVVFYTAHYDQNKGQIDVQEIDMFLGRNYLITVHEHPLSELDEVEQRWTRNAKQLTWGIGVLLYSLLDTIVDNYFPIVDSLVDHADDLEDRLYAGRTRNSHITLQILDLKKQFTRMRRIATPERDVLNVLTNRDNPLFDEHVLIYFRDIYDHITRLADTVDIYRDQLSSTMDANLAIVSNDLNKVMRTLTGASIILMADALIAGIYGMNFKNIPELELPWGYFACLGLMFALSVLLVLYFKRLKWL